LGDAVRRVCRTKRAGLSGLGLSFGFPIPLPDYRQPFKLSTAKPARLRVFLLNSIPIK
jgi:hypothetical protein